MLLQLQSSASWMLLISGGSKISGKEISGVLERMAGNPTSNRNDTAAFATIMMASVTRQS